MKDQIHACRFDSADDLTGKKRTYAAVKARVLEVGRFSVFEATANAKSAAIFMCLERDADIETFRNPPGFPWIGVRRSQRGK